MHLQTAALQPRVLTDDNFTSIVKAVEKGRAIYAGIQKFVAFIMSVHIAEAAWGLAGWLGLSLRVGPGVGEVFQRDVSSFTGLCLVHGTVLPVPLQGVVLKCNVWPKLILFFETSEF